MLAAILICGTAAMFISCAANEDIPSEKTIADLVVYGKVFTSESNQIVEAFAVKDGKYVYVGDKEGAKAFIETGKTEVVDYSGKFWSSCQATGQMFLIAGGFTLLFGSIFGVLLTVTKKGGIAENRWVYAFVNALTNVFRSIPFVILRAISDKAGDEADVEFGTFEHKAAENCANVLAHMVRDISRAQ